MSLTLDEILAITDPLQRAAQATALIRETEHDVIEAALRVRERAVKQCRADGHSLRTIGNAIGLTPERVRLIAKLPDLA